MPRRPSRTESEDSPAPGLMTIGALSRATGIAAPTLRTWERRYRSPEPERKPSGHRLYPASLVERLRKVALLLDRGHRPGEILPLAPADLDSLLALPGAGPGPLDPGAAPVTADPGAQDVELERMLRAIRALDRDALTGLLRRTWSRLGPLPFVERAAAVLMAAIGESWRQGSLQIRHEHFATAVLSDFLREVREPLDRAARGPLVVAAMLPGDAHEGGLLMASVVLAAHGFRVLYLGLDTPVEQIASAARDRGARAVAVSLSVTVPRARASRAIAALRQALPRRTALWTGGAGAPKPGRAVERFESLAQLHARVGA